MKMRNVVGSLAATLAALSVLVVTENAHAQDAATTAPVTTTTTTTTTTGGTDHDSVVGHIGVGWFGVGEVPIGLGGTPGAGATPKPASTISVPAIGIRYWLQDGLGIDVGVGFNTTSGSSKGGGTSFDGPSGLGFWLHAGVPIKLGDAGKHLTFLVTPEANLGIASGSQPSADPNGKATDLSGFRLQAGARAGAEIQFGFIGIPQLALEGSVGLFLDVQSFSNSPPSPNPEQSGSTLTIATSSINQPWDFFKGTVAARYYF